MALDTRSKRASSVGIALFFVLAPPLPDASLSQGDRQHIAISYSGILATPFYVIEPTAYVRVIVPVRPRRLVVPKDPLTEVPSRPRRIIR